MMRDKKLIRAIVAFMLFIPFRLPISVLLIQVFNSTAKIGSESLPIEVLTTNVMITKFIYNLIIASIMCYNIEHLSRQLLGRSPIEQFSIKENPKTIFYWTGISIVLSIAFIALDMWNTFTLSMMVNN